MDGIDEFIGWAKTPYGEVVLPANSSTVVTQSTISYYPVFDYFVGYTKIYDANGLKLMNSDGKYVLMDDIELTGEWRPIEFSGTFDGNGKTISGMRITVAPNIFVDKSLKTENGEGDWNNTEYASSGLFSKLINGAVVRNLVIKDYRIQYVSDTDAVNLVGALAGFTHNATIDNVVVKIRGGHF